MEGQETAKEIDRDAADWAARLDRGALSPEDQSSLDAWTAGDPRRLGALARAMAVSAHFDRANALGGGVRPGLRRGRRSTPVLARRRFMQGGLAAAAAGGVFVVGLQLSSPSLMTAWLDKQRGQYRTAKGEVRSVPLPDGSTIWLNTESEVRVRYSRGRRDIILARGEALFDVAKDPARPFVVHSGEMHARAVGTSFSVSEIAKGQVRVEVAEGVVEFAAARPGRGAPVRLAAGAKAVSDQSGRIDVTVPGTATVSRALSWRRGMLDFDGVTLAEAAATFARYSDERIQIDDPGVSRLTVVGLFSSNDPAGFARAVALSMNLKASRESGVIHIRR
jgi:transmembrane sensor